MTTPEEIRAKADALWSSHKVLRAHIDGASLFPWEISIARPGPRALADDFPRIRESIARLRLGAKERVGFGYRIEYEQIRLRRLGDQSLPRRAVVDSLDDFLRMIEKQEEFLRFTQRIARILEINPELRSFLSKDPSVVLENAEDWDRLLAVCRYFREHPKPALYLRQLEIPGVHTKFIESRRTLLWKLLDVLLCPEAKNEEIVGLSNHGFERRFGLRVEPPMVRFRLLDRASSLGGLTDITASLPEFAALAVPVTRVFLAENKINGLCFPETPGGMVIFGLGYGIRCLADVPWLRKIPMHYWGDIDTHGFAILDQAREIFPKIRSFLMDQETLLSFRELWVQEEPGERFTNDLARLTPDENALFISLRDNIRGNSIRLEQERIPFGFVCQRIAMIAPEI